MKSRQDVVNKVDDLSFALNEIRTNSTNEPIDYQASFDAVEAAIEAVKKDTEPKATP